MKTLLFATALTSAYLLARWLEKRRSVLPPASHAGGLDAPLMWWGNHDPFTIRDLLRSLCTMGASGSGKTSSVGFRLGKALAACPKVGGLIIASKPEDRAFWGSIFESAGRELTVIDPNTSHRFNVIDFEGKAGADAREITQCIMTIGETLMRAEGGGRDPFWEQQNRRTINGAVEVLKQAHGKVDVWGIQRFINGAALSGEELGSEKWQAGFHNKSLAEASPKPKEEGGKLKSAIEAHDYYLAQQFWLNEWPYMNDKTRSSILAGVMGLLHVFNTGIVREMIGTGTTISPAAFDQGTWIMVDMPIANHGAAGAFVAGAWKYATQRHVLRRAATDETPATCIWIDEYQNHITSFDAKYLAECRSHLGCMVVLTQSIHSFFSAIGGREAQSQTKALLTNFGHKVFMALGDEESAKYASSLVGRAVIRLASVSRNGMGALYEELMGRINLGSSLAEHIEDLIQARLFMNGLRTGGPENGYFADGWVIRNGKSFSNGENVLFVGFTQQQGEVMPQPQQRDDQKIDNAYVLGLLYFLCNAHRVCITTFIRHSFGTRAFEFQAVAALLTLWVAGGLYPGFGFFFLLWLAALIVQRIQSYRIRSKGIVQHSRYQGYPWLAMRMPFIKSEQEAKRFEPLLCFLLGSLVATVWDRLGLFIMAGFVSFGVCLAIETAILHQRMQAMVDAELELGYFAERSRGRAI